MKQLLKIFDSILHYYILCGTFKGKLYHHHQVGRCWTATGWQWNEQLPFPHGNSLNSAYNSHVTRCLCLRLLTEGFCFPQPQNFWNFPTTLTFLFCPPKQQFSNGKTWCLKIKLWFKVIFSKCVQGLCWNIFLICLSQIVTVLEREIWISFFLTANKLKLPFVKVTPYWWGDFEQLWLCLFYRNACTMNHLFSHLEKRHCMVYVV